MAAFSVLYKSSATFSMTEPFLNGDFFFPFPEPFLDPFLSTLTDPELWIETPTFLSTPFEASLVSKTPELPSSTASSN
jgi:hypothetical protein